MKIFSKKTTIIPLLKTVGYSRKFKCRLIAICSCMFFGITVSAQPVLINPSITCSSLDKINVEGCYRAALDFDPVRLTADVAALYRSDNPPITVTVANTTADQNNSYHSWSFIYTFKIQDASSNFVTCDVTYSGNDNTLPTFTVPPDINLYQTSHCDLFFPDTTMSGSVKDAFDACGILAVQFLDCGDRKGINIAAPCPENTCIGQRIVERTWIVRDSAGNTAVGLQRIYILDTIKPVFTVFPDNPSIFSCENVNYDVVVNDNCSGPVALSYTFSGATTGSGSGTGNGSIFNYGTTTVTITARDCVGNTQQRNFDVKVSCDKSININISAAVTTTIYSGTFSGQGPFGPQGINLCSTVTGGAPGAYTYFWTPGTGLSNRNIANPVASPTVTTTYTLLVTDHAGHTRNLSITITVLPLSSAVCGGNGNNTKFNVCHIPPGNPGNGHNICVSVNALPAHLIGGSNGHNNCYLGPCGQQLCFSTNASGCQGSCGSSQPQTNSMEMNMTAEFNVTVSPNPSSSDFNIEVFSKSNEPVTVRILDNSGVVRSVSALSSKNNSIMVGSKLPAGIYMAEVIQGINRQVVKLIKQN